MNVVHGKPKPTIPSHLEKSSESQSALVLAKHDANANIVNPNTNSTLRKQLYHCLFQLCKFQTADRPSVKHHFATEHNHSTSTSPVDVNVSDATSRNSPNKSASDSNVNRREGNAKRAAKRRKVHLPPPGVKVRCHICNYQTASRKLMTTHYRSMHSAVTTERYLCRLCPYVTFHVANLNFHLSSVHNSSQPATLVKCTRCSYEASDKAMLDKHTKLVHDKTMHIECLYCDRYLAPTETHMKWHVQRCHPKQALLAENDNQVQMSDELPDDSPLSDHDQFDDEGPQLREMQSIGDESGANLMDPERITFQMDELCPTDDFSPNEDLDSDPDAVTTVIIDAPHLPVGDEQVATSKPKRNLLTCSWCNVTHKSVALLRAHEEEVHLKQKPFKCPVCPYAAARKQHVISHSRVHSKRLAGRANANTWCCVQCDYFSDVSSVHLNFHIQTVHMKRTVAKCIYGVPLTDAPNVDRSDRDEMAKRVFESGCDFIADMPFRMLRHVKTMHWNERNFKCDLCPFRGVDKWALTVHKWKHVRTKKFTCSLCPHSTLHRSQMRHHIETKHRDEANVIDNAAKPDGSDDDVGDEADVADEEGADNGAKRDDRRETLACDTCEKVFRSVSGLRSHKRMVHEAGFQCSICQYKSHLKSEIRRHMMDHAYDFVEVHDTDDDNDVARTGSVVSAESSAERSTSSSSKSAPDDGVQQDDGGVTKRPHSTTDSPTERGDFD